MESPADVIANDLRRLPMQTRKALRPKLRKAGEITAQAVKANASWSKRIPGTTRVRTSFRLDGEGVEVVVGGPRAPHARLYEGPKDFRAPLFGNRRHWYRHGARPFLRPAAKATEGQATALMRQALDETGSALGFR